MTVLHYIQVILKANAYQYNHINFLLSKIRCKQCISSVCENFMNCFNNDKNSM